MTYWRVLDAVLSGKFVSGSLHDKAVLSELFSAHQFEAVVHFAGSIAVGESRSAAAMVNRPGSWRTLARFAKTRLVTTLW